ncbi:hypothetical protein Zmor_012344 [Zophobas morio]|uniref:Uncharacterized protein n=1 Tax=Zophobas morio TaxID=2755281 RepID=A0AA38HF46_9CUCU|nr:hypothetical protein Zmor_012344 [Zophobas morio]
MVLLAGISMVNTVSSHMHTRLGIQLAVNKLSQHLNSFGKEHWEAAKCIFRYPKGTSHSHIRSFRKGKLDIQDYLDAIYGFEQDH